MNAALGEIRQRTAAWRSAGPAPHREVAVDSVAQLESLAAATEQALQRNLQAKAVKAQREEIMWQERRLGVSVYACVKTPL